MRDGGGDTPSCDVDVPKEGLVHGPDSRAEVQASRRTSPAAWRGWAGYGLLRKEAVARLCDGAVAEGPRQPQVTRAGQHLDPCERFGPDQRTGIGVRSFGVVPRKKALQP